MESISYPDEIGNVIADGVNLPRQINIKVDSDDVQELLNSHKQEFSIYKLIEMHEQEQGIEKLESSAQFN
ncbi:hypothetical protein TNCV_4331831 [Trichonephila clavipes]|nr:hypothetical protein TNCV_4331831 [Trichonephila clavipes]